MIFDMCKKNTLGRVQGGIDGAILTRSVTGLKELPNFSCFRFGNIGTHLHVCDNSLPLIVVVHRGWRQVVASLTILHTLHDTS